MPPSGFSLAGQQEEAPVLQPKHGFYHLHMQCPSGENDYLQNEWFQLIACLSGHCGGSRQVDEKQMCTVLRYSKGGVLHMTLDRYESR